MGFHGDFMGIMFFCSVGNVWTGYNQEGIPLTSSKYTGVVWLLEFTRYMVIITISNVNPGLSLGPWNSKLSIKIETCFQDVRDYIYFILPHFPLLYTFISTVGLLYLKLKLAFKTMGFEGVSSKKYKHIQVGVNVYRVGHSPYIYIYVYIYTHTSL